MQSEEEYYLNQIPKPRSTRITASKIGNVLNRVIQQRGYAALQSNELLRDAWEKAIGVEMAKLTRVGNVERGALLVFVPNSVIQNEMEYLKTQALRYLQTHLAEYKIRSIRIKLDRG